MKNQQYKISALERDERAISMPARVPLGRAMKALREAILEAFRTGSTWEIVQVCNDQLKPLLDAQTELAYLKGGRRIQLTSERVLSESKKEYAPVRFSLSDDDETATRGVADYLRKISGIDPSNFSNSFEKHNAGAIGNLASAICDEVKKAQIDLTLAGIHVKGGKAEIARILAKNGVQAPNLGALAETLFRTHTQQAYSAGRWNTATDPDFADEIWGFEYVTAHDPRVREGHRVLDGVRLPKEDPFWAKYFPPNGWNCRCTTLDIWYDDAEAKINFGITGRDPRKRTPEEMDVSKEFQGNVGIFTTPEPPKPKFDIDKLRREAIAEVKKKAQSQFKSKFGDDFFDRFDIQVSGDGYIIIWDAEVISDIQIAPDENGLKFALGKRYSALINGTRKQYTSLWGAVSALLRAVWKEEEKKRKPEFSFPTAPTELKVVNSNIGGSTGAKLCEDKWGYKFIRKQGGGVAKVSREHLASECSADAFYRAMGINVPEFQSYEENGEIVKLSRFMEDMKPFADWWNSATQKEKTAMQAKLRDGFATDILLGNWDVLGMSGDNIMVDPKGEPWRIDNGGSLSFRAQGAKKDKTLWEDGFPDDIWTMRGINPDGTVFGNANRWTKDIFGNLDTLTVVQDIAKKDWTKAMETLNDDDKKVVEKRLAEIRQLAERGTPFKDDGYEDFHVETILGHSYRLSKEGFRESVPDIKTGKNGMPTDFGFFRSTGGSGSSKPTDADVQSAALKALKTVATHLQDKQYNNSTLKTFYNYETVLKQEVANGNADAQYYLDIMEKVKKAVKSKAKTPKPLPMMDTTKPVFTVATQTNIPGASNYVSLTDWIHQSMSDEERDFIVKWQGSQGLHSYNKDACNFKITRLLSYGYNSLQEAENDGYFLGVPKDRREVEGAWKNLQKDSRLREIAISAYGKYQAAMQLILENSDFSGNNRQEKNVILVRTEANDVAGNVKIGEKCTHKTGVAESHSIFKPVFIFADTTKGCVTLVKVPYHRISATYFLEQNAGKNDWMFLGDGENEFNADTHGLDIILMDVGNHNKESKSYYSDFLSYLKKYQKTP